MEQVKPKSGMKLSHYNLNVKLSEGTFSETWLAEHAYLEGKKICLKIFTDEKFCRFLASQKNLTLDENFPHFPHVEDYDPMNLPPYLAEEVVSGRSVRQSLKMQKRFTIDNALETFSKVVQVVSKFHEQNLVHLDIRPEHIILDDKGGIKILDYMLGNIITLTLGEYYKEFSSTGVPLPKAIMRSLIYKPKKQRMGMDFSKSCDIFALGILLFEFVTGTYPNKDVAVPSRFFPEIPPKIDKIYSQCCSKEEDMFESCQDILNAVQAKENIPEAVVSNVLGVRLITEKTALVSIHELAGKKHYVDGKNITLLSKNLDNILSTPLRFLIFDLSNIDYLNSSAIGFLVNLSDRVHQKGGFAVMCNADKKVLTILNALGLEKVMNIMGSLEKAKSYISQLTTEELGEG